MGHDQIVRWLLAAVEFTPRELEIAEEEYRCRAPRKRVRQESGLDGLDLLHFFSPKHKHKHKRFAGTAQAKLLLHKERRALNWIRRRDALLVRARVTLRSTAGRYFPFSGIFSLICDSVECQIIV